MKKVLIVLLILLVGGGVFLYYPRTSGTAAANAATLAILNAGVESQRAGASFLPALDGDVLAGGDQVRADAQGRAVLSYFDGSSLTVEPGAQVKVTQLERVGADGLATTIELTAGRIWAAVEKLKPGSRFEVRTPTTTAIVRGTAFEISVAADGTTTVKTTEGEVVVQAQGQTQSVTPGQQNTTPPGAPPGTPQPQPPAPKLRLLSQLNGLGYVVIDPQGRTCGATGGQAVRQIPGCDVVIGAAAGAGGQQTDIGELTAGTYTMLLTSSAVINGISVALSGGADLAAPDFRQQFGDAGGIRPGELVKTTFDVTLQGATVGGRPFAPGERLATVCGADVRGRIFNTGTLPERTGGLAAFAAAGRNQPTAIVIEDKDLTAEVQKSVGDLGESPAKVSGLAVTIDAAGVHMAAQVSAGPITIPGKGDIIAGTSAGKLSLRVRSMDLGILPSALKEQLITALNKGLDQLAAGFPMVVTRVAMRPGCMAIVGTTNP